MLHFLYHYHKYTASFAIMYPAMGEIVFKKVLSLEPVASYLSQRIGDKLSRGQRVLWLVPGGSAIAVAVAAASQLKSKDLHNLTVTLTDERYGPVGHKDSNWQQLADQGFRLAGANLIPVLNNESAEVTANRLAVALQAQLAQSDYAIGLFGIGADGHTAGILPGSPAVNAQVFAAGYQADPYYRITMTGPAIAKLDEAIVFAMDESKQPVIDQLGTDVPVEKQPAQFLKQTQKLIIYNGYKGEKS